MLFRSRVFLKYDWPGNVRELQNVVESCVVLCSRDTIQPEDLPEQLVQTKLLKSSSAISVDTSQYPERLEEAVAACERTTILLAMEKAGRDRKKAIEILGIPRRTFYRKIQKYQIPLN